MTSSSAAPRSKLGFLDLPPELRREIYLQLLMPGEPWWPSRRYCPDYFNIRPPVIIPEPPDTPQIMYPQILRTCKTCCHEARHFLYSKLHFSVNTRYDIKTFTKQFLPTIGSVNASLIKSIDSSNLFRSTRQMIYHNSSIYEIPRHVYLKRMFAILKACPNLEYFEIHVDDIFLRHRWQVREMAHLVKMILRNHPTLTRAIEYVGRSKMSGMSLGDWCVLVGKEDRLPNGRKLSRYRLLMDITTGYRVCTYGKNPWRDKVWTGIIPPLENCEESDCEHGREHWSYPGVEYSIRSTTLATPEDCEVDTEDEERQRKWRDRKIVNKEDYFTEEEMMSDIEDDTTSDGRSYKEYRKWREECKQREDENYKQAFPLDRWSAAFPVDIRLCGEAGYY